ncbi:MAG: GNAT family N-acetyltransferase [Myxococcota bacterium]
MCATARWASPPDCRGEPRDGAVAWRAGGDADWFAFRLELDRPPEDLPAAFARWDAEGHPAPVGRRSVCWEVDVDVPGVDVPERYAPVTLLGMVRTGRPPSVRPTIARAPPDEAADAARALGPAYDLRWLLRGLAAGGGTILAAREGGRIVGAVAVCRRPGEARLRELWVAPAQRGRGLGAALLDAAVAHAGDRRVVVAAEDAAVGLYERAGFRAVSRFVVASTPR